MSFNKTHDFFNSYAHDFASIYGNNNSLWNKLINKYFRTSMKLRYLMAIEGCTPLEGKNILDVGCGPGHYCIPLIQGGAASVTGIDFAEEMIDLANKNAQKAGVADKCHFICDNFYEYNFETPFDYSIVMGFMDYTADPEKLIDKVLEVTTTKAFFSFPLDGGFLALKRKWKYKKRCDLYLYTMDQIYKYFKNRDVKKVEFEKISRDVFVTVCRTNEAG